MKGLPIFSKKTSQRLKTMHNNRDGTHPPLHRSANTQYWDSFQTIITYTTIFGSICYALIHIGTVLRWVKQILFPAPHYSTDDVKRIKQKVL